MATGSPRTRHRPRPRARPRFGSARPARSRWPSSRHRHGTGPRRRHAGPGVDLRQGRFRHAHDTDRPAEAATPPGAPEPVMPTRLVSSRASTRTEPGSRPRRPGRCWPWWPRSARPPRPSPQSPRSRPPRPRRIGRRPRRSRSPGRGPEDAVLRAHLGARSDLGQGVQPDHPRRRRRVDRQPQRGPTEPRWRCKACPSRPGPAPAAWRRRSSRHS